MSSSSSPLRIGPWICERELGRGGMGSVVAARHEADGRRVALKLLAPGADAAARERFVTEGRALARLSHPHVVRVHALEAAGPQAYLVMELVEGESLGARLRSGPLEPQRALRTLRDVVAAVGHLHAHGVLHRDLKPDNVLVEGGATDGRVVLADFGLARDAEAERARLTQTGELLGTPSYMAPEQASGERGAVGAATDVYGLGATLYALLTGRPPFDGPSLVNTLEAVLTRPAAAPSALRPDLPPGADELVMRCLAKSPAERPSLAELARGLDALLAPGGALEVPGPRGPTAVAAAALAVCVIVLVLALAHRRGEAEPRASERSGDSAAPARGAAAAPERAPASEPAPRVAPEPAPEPEPAPARSRPEPVIVDGWTWTSLEPPGRPDPPRYAIDAAFVHDRARGCALLFGGANTRHKPLADTWAWDGADWQLVPARGPSARANHAMAYDPVRKRVMLFGGDASLDEDQRVFAELWAWDGARWEEVPRREPWPAGRLHHKMAWDPLGQRLLVFGGRCATPEGRHGAVVGDLWSWDGERWRDLSLEGAPPRTKHAMTFDAARGCLVVVGGEQADDTVWEWDGARWLDLRPPGSGPGPRYGGGLVFDGARAILVGGYDHTRERGDPRAYLADCWAWDGAAWDSLELVGLGPAGGRARGGVLWDADRRVLVVFGGAHAGGNALADTWELRAPAPSGAGR